jgi:hypothetical protein
MGHSFFACIMQIFQNTNIFTSTITVATSSPPPPLTGVQGLCSVVVWYGSENLTCKNMIKRYEVIFHDSNLPASNMTRYVEPNRTFYILTDEDKSVGEDAYVQVSYYDSDA